jgi:hypothetical protein
MFTRTTDAPHRTMCVGLGEVTGAILAEAQVPFTFGVSLPSSIALAFAQQLFVLGGLIPLETIKRLFRHF